MEPKGPTRRALGRTYTTNVTCKGSQKQEGLSAETSGNPRRASSYHETDEPRKWLRELVVDINIRFFMNGVGNDLKEAERRLVKSKIPAFTVGQLSTSALLLEGHCAGITTNSQHLI